MRDELLDLGRLQEHARALAGRPRLLAIGQRQPDVGAVADVPERQWLSAIFAQATGQPEAAADLAKKAVEAKPDFRDLRPRFFPRAKL